MKKLDLVLGFVQFLDEAELYSSDYKMTQEIILYDSAQFLKIFTASGKLYTHLTQKMTY